MNTRALGLMALKVCAVSTLVGLTAYANEVNVSDSYRVVMSDINSTLTLTPTNSANWRTVVGDPVFWFDASERDGWVLDGSDIVKIPSKVGERYLTSDWTEQGTSFTGWGSGKNICPPQLVTDDKLGNGGWVVEFGALGSMRALLFNAVARSSDGAVKSYLENIGSVVAVYNSANSGGYFLLGGGRFSGRDYIRAGDQDGGSAINYWNGLLAALRRFVKKDIGVLSQSKSPGLIAI